MDQASTPSSLTSVLLAAVDSAQRLQEALDTEHAVTQEFFVHTLAASSRVTGEGETAADVVPWGPHLLAPLAPPRQVLQTLELETQCDLVHHRTLEGGLEVRPLGAGFTRRFDRRLETSQRLVVEVRAIPSLERPDTPSR